MRVPRLKFSRSASLLAASVRQMGMQGGFQRRAYEPSCMHEIKSWEWGHLMVASCGCGWHMP